MSLWLHDTPLVLASKSAVRRNILQAAGLAPDINPADVDERRIEQEQRPSGPQAAAALLSREKALAVSRQMPGRIVLGADQTLALGQKRFSKPSGRDAARDQLRQLAGQTHELHSAAAVAHDGAVVFEANETVRLTMRAMSDDALDRYLDAAGPAVTTSVGAYQIESVGIHLFERIEGDYFGILGLPLLKLLDHFRRAGWVAR